MHPDVHVNIGASKSCPSSWCCFSSAPNVVCGMRARSCCRLCCIRAQSASSSSASTLTSVASLGFVGCLCFQYYDNERRRRGQQFVCTASRRLDPVTTFILYSTFVSARLSEPASLAEAAKQNDITARAATQRTDCHGWSAVRRGDGDGGVYGGFVGTEAQAHGI